MTIRIRMGRLGSSCHAVRGSFQVRCPRMVELESVWPTGHEFLAAYREARQKWLAGANVAFPPRTYWLAQFAPISTVPLPS